MPPVSEFSQYRVGLTVAKCHGHSINLTHEKLLRDLTPLFDGRAVLAPLNAIAGTAEITLIGLRHLGVRKLRSL